MRVRLEVGKLEIGDNDSRERSDRIKKVCKGRIEKKEEGRKEGKR